MLADIEEFFVGVSLAAVCSRVDFLELSVYPEGDEVVLQFGEQRRYLS
jgi:hypothetical protein